MIVCKINIFDIKQSVYVMNGNLITKYQNVTMDNIDKLAVRFCYDNNDFSVRLVGPQSYTQIIRDRILKQNKILYNENHTIEVEN